VDFGVREVNLGVKGGWRMVIFGSDNVRVCKIGARLERGGVGLAGGGGFEDDAFCVVKALRDCDLVVRFIILAKK
jgi:hypothetical protein